MKLSTNVAKGITIFGLGCSLDSDNFELIALLKRFKVELRGELARLIENQLTNQATSIGLSWWILFGHGEILEQSAVSRRFETSYWISTSTSRFYIFMFARRDIEQLYRYANFVHTLTNITVMKSDVNESDMLAGVPDSAEDQAERKFDFISIFINIPTRILWKIRISSLRMAIIES